MTRLRCYLLMAAAAAFVSACGDTAEPVATSPAPEQADGPGIVDRVPEDLPKNAQVVPLDDGTFMVPYEAETPGFDVTYHMTPVPGGTFTMGSPPDEESRQEDEGPQFDVEVEPFWIGVYPVTWAEYWTFMDMLPMLRHEHEGHSGLPSRDDWQEDSLADAVTLPTPIYHPPFVYELGGDPEHPAVTMTPYAARQYTKWLTHLTSEFYRLPTEAEWEYAARAGTTTAWSFGDDVEQLRRYSHHYYPDMPWEATHHLHVNSLQPNPWGLYHMHGNVTNLVLDRYIEDHYAQFADRDAPVHYSEVIAWPMERWPTVVRGGSLDHDPEDTRSAARRHTDRMWHALTAMLPESPWWFANNEPQATGFRIVRPLHEPDTDAKHRFWASRKRDMGDDLWRAVRSTVRDGRGNVLPLNDDLLDHIERWQADNAAGGLRGPRQR